MPSSLFGPMALSGFEHSWFLLFLLVPLGLIAVYVVMRREPPLRTLRFANMEILQRVAPTQTKRWRQLPAVLLIASLVAVAIALAGPTDDVRVPRDRAVVMLVVDVSQSMRANDVRPSRLVAAQEAAKQFADELPPGIRLGFVAYAGTASMLVAPTTDRAVTKAAIDGLQLADRTATGESIFTALQTIATVGEVLGGARDETPARIVLMSDGKRRSRPIPIARGAPTRPHVRRRGKECRSPRSPSVRLAAPSPLMVGNSQFR